jgi:hypothetical protein
MKNILKVPLLIVAFIYIGIFAQAEVPAPPYRTLEVEDFSVNSSLEHNRLGRKHGVFLQRPSTVKFSAKELAIITYNKASDSMVGFYTELGIDRTPYLDLTSYDDLELTGVFPSGNEYVLNFITTGNSAAPYTVQLRDFQTASENFRLPLSAFPDLPLEQVVSLRIQPLYSGAGEFQLKKLRFYQYNEPLFKNPSPQTLLIDNFNGMTNRFGDRDDSYCVPPSKISILRLPKTKVAPQDRCLRIIAVNKEDGLCLYAHSFLKNNEPFPLANYQSLLFKVRGARGGEDPELAFTDDTTDSYLHPWLAGKLSKYLGHPLTTQWEGVIVPLADFGPIPGNKVKELLLVFPQEETNMLYLDDLQLSLKRYTEEGPALPQVDLLLYGFAGTLTDCFGEPLTVRAEQPSQVKLATTLVGAAAKDDPCLEIRYHKFTGADCAVTGKFTSKDKTFSAENYRSLTFQVRGDPQAVFNIYLIDQNVGDAAKGTLPVTLKKVTVRNISGQWQWVTIPLADFGVDTSALQGIVLEFPEKGEGTLYLDTVSLLK